MTAKDFIAIQTAIKDARECMRLSHEEPALVGRVFDSLSRDIAKILATTNPKFQRMRFLSACGVDTANQPLHRNK